MPLSENSLYLYHCNYKVELSLSKENAINSQAIAIHP